MAFCDYLWGPTSCQVPLYFVSIGSVCQVATKKKALKVWRVLFPIFLLVSLFSLAVIGSNYPQVLPQTTAATSPFEAERVSVCFEQTRNTKKSLSWENFSSLLQKLFAESREIHLQCVTFNHIVVTLSYVVHHVRTNPCKIVQTAAA